MHYPLNPENFKEKKGGTSPQSSPLPEESWTIGPLMEEELGRRALVHGRGGELKPPTPVKIPKKCPLASPGVQPDSPKAAETPLSSCSARGLGLGASRLPPKARSERPAPQPATRCALRGSSRGCAAGTLPLSRSAPTSGSGARKPQPKAHSEKPAPKLAERSALRGLTRVALLKCRRTAAQPRRAAREPAGRRPKRVAKGLPQAGTQGALSNARSTPTFASPLRLTQPPRCVTARL